MSNALTVRFNNHDIHVIEFQGHRCFLVNEVAAALEYKDPRDLARKITGKWSNEFVEGLDCFKLAGEDLGSMKNAVGDSPPGSPIIHPKTSSLIILTESGVNLACIKARTEKGKEFRRWLVSEVLPALATGRAPEGLLVAPLDHLLPPPAGKDTEQARLSIACVKLLSRNGALVDPELSLEILSAWELATGKVQVHARRSVERTLKRLAAGMGQQALPFLLDPPEDAEIIDDTADEAA